MIKKLDFIQDYKNFNYKTVKLGYRIIKNRYKGYIVFIKVKNRYYTYDDDLVYINGLFGTNVYYFKYYKMTLFRFKNLTSFLKAIENGYIRMNIKINFYNKEPYYGKLHNKGTTFEIMEDNFKEIFDVINLE